MMMMLQTQWKMNTYTGSLGLISGDERTENNNCVGWNNGRIGKGRQRTEIKYTSSEGDVGRVSALISGHGKRLRRLKGGIGNEASARSNRYLRCHVSLLLHIFFVFYSLLSRSVAIAIGLRDWIAKGTTSAKLNLCNTPSTFYRHRQAQINAYYINTICPIEADMLFSG